MEFKRVINSNFYDFKQIWEIYEYSFPQDERRNLKSQIKLFKNDNYFFYAVYDSGLVGIISFWDFKDFIFVEHLAIKKDIRGKGFGKKLLKTFISTKNKKIILEVKVPDTKPSGIKFYKGLGFKLNKYRYIQPPYDKDKNPVRMIIMSYPKTILPSEFSVIRKKIHKSVYGFDKPFV